MLNYLLVLSSFFINFPNLATKVRKYFWIAKYFFLVLLFFSTLFAFVKKSYCQFVLFVSVMELLFLSHNTHADRESCRILVEAMCGNLSKCMSLRACSVCFCAALLRSILGVSSSVSIYALCRYMEYGQKIKSLRVVRDVLTFISFCLFSFRCFCCCG